MILHALSPVLKDNSFLIHVTRSLKVFILQRHKRQLVQVQRCSNKVSIHLVVMARRKVMQTSFGSALSSLIYLRNIRSGLLVLEVRQTLCH